MEVPSARPLRSYMARRMGFARGAELCVRGAVEHGRLAHVSMDGACGAVAYGLAMRGVLRWRDPCRWKAQGWSWCIDSRIRNSGVLPAPLWRAPACTRLLLLPIHSICLPCLLVAAELYLRPVVEHCASPGRRPPLNAPQRLRPSTSASPQHRGAFLLHHRHTTLPLWAGLCWFSAAIPTSPSRPKKDCAIPPHYLTSTSSTRTPRGQIFLNISTWQPSAGLKLSP
jgi:hypothetical protein